VLWNNSFLCDGYDSLCWCLTSHHDLTTIHWAHAGTTVRQPLQTTFATKSVTSGKAQSEHITSAIPP
jgi:hypothetical protein